MERELLFADKLQNLRETAKAQGKLLTEAQVKEAFADFALDEEQLALVYDYLKKHNRKYVRWLSDRCLVLEY